MKTFTVHKFSQSSDDNKLDLKDQEEYCMGIDEAGRGPVLGPMVYAVAYCKLSDRQKLNDVGFDDSKKLSEQQRDEMFQSISESDWLQYSCTVLSPQDISNKMLRRSKYNLNQLSFDTAIDLVRHALSNGYNITELYVDTVGSPQKYTELLRKTFPSIDKICVESKADAKYAIVSAASICAKVTRDAQLKQWKFRENSFTSVGEMGCGYPSDPITKQWLRDNFDPVFGFPSLIRFSWATCYNYINDNGVAVFWPLEEQDQENQAVAAGKKRKQSSSQSSQQTTLKMDQAVSTSTTNNKDDTKMKSAFMQSIKANLLQEFKL
ncbi:hypothetical protein MIR68_008866 [Amoeboaphelidium protococcarum]|nr:hypothetical protein MIR68_008866 [Amoeboaphelidium protococcarum]